MCSCHGCGVIALEGEVSQDAGVYSLTSLVLLVQLFSIIKILKAIKLDGYSPYKLTLVPYA